LGGYEDRGAGVGWKKGHAGLICTGGLGKGPKGVKKVQGKGSQSMKVKALANETVW